MHSNSHLQSPINGLFKWTNYIIHIGWLYRRKFLFVFRKFYFCMLKVIIHIQFLSNIQEVDGLWGTFPVELKWSTDQKVWEFFFFCGGFSRHVGLSSFGMWAQLPCGAWNFPGPRIKPMSPTLPGRFLTCGPAGKSKKTENSLENKGSDKAAKDTVNFLPTHSRSCPDCLWHCCPCLCCVVYTSRWHRQQTRYRRKGVWRHRWPFSALPVMPLFLQSS